MINPDYTLEPRQKSLKAHKICAFDSITIVCTMMIETKQVQLYILRCSTIAEMSNYGVSFDC